MAYRIALLFLLLTISKTASAAAAVIVGVVVGAGAGIGLSLTVGTAIAIGIGAASAYMAYTTKVPTAAQTQSELKQTVQGSRTPRNVWYGKSMMSGAMLFAEEQVGDSKNDNGTYREWLYVANGVCDHSIKGAVNVYFNETDIGEFGDNAEFLLHNADGQGDSYLEENAPSWQSDMKGGEVTWVRCGMLFDSDLFANGVPTIRIEGEGKDTLYDPRDGSYGYSNNAALVILDFMVNYLGLPLERMLMTGFGNWIDAINLCEENVVNADGTSSPRYTINGIFNYEEKPADVLDDMLAACGGSLVRMGGYYGLLPAAYNGPATFTLTSEDIISDVNIQIEPSYSDSVNTVTGSFVDPDQFYVETDYPPVIDETAVLRDGGTLSEDLSLRFVNDVYQAQRLANILLKKKIAGGTISFTANLKGCYARIGRVITLDIPESNIYGEYRVVEQSVDIYGGVELNLVQEDIDIYDDAIGTEYVAPPLTNLPVGALAPPTGVQFYVDSIGEVVQGIVSWQINAPQSVKTDIRFKDYLTEEVVMVGTSIGDSYNVNSLTAGNYIVEVRSVSMTGKTSAWATASFIIDVPPMPDGVTIKASNWNVLLTPYVNGGTPSGTLFEFRALEDTNSFLSDTPAYGEEDFYLSTSIGISSTYNQGGLTPDRYQHYWVRGTNSYGQSDWFYIRTGTTRDQDLVTTVVERLQAIEILSANWDEGDGLSGDYANGMGYKLFAPDPNDSSADGRAVFNDIWARGKIKATSMEFVTPDAIPDEINNSKLDIYENQSSIQIKSANFISDSRGWAIYANGNCEFNDGVFRGTIYANEIVGDLVSAKTFSVDSATNIADTWNSVVIGTTTNVTNNTGDSATVEIAVPVIWYEGNAEWFAVGFTVSVERSYNGGGWSEIKSFNYETASNTSRNGAANDFYGQAAGFTVSDTLAYGSGNNYAKYRVKVTRTKDEHVDTIKALSNTFTCKIFRDGGAWA